MFFPQLNQAVPWLLSRVPPALSLSCQTLAQLVESTLSREFTARVFAQLQERASARLTPAEPAPVVRLYNAVVAHIAETVASQDLVGISWPPCEFWRPETSGLVPHLDWNSARHLDWLRRAILSLQLPLWTQPSGSGQCQTLELILTLGLKGGWAGCLSRSLHTGNKLLSEEFAGYRKLHQNSAIF